MDRRKLARLNEWSGAMRVGLPTNWRLVFPLYVLLNLSAALVFVFLNGVTVWSVVLGVVLCTCTTVVSTYALVYWASRTAASEAFHPEEVVRHDEYLVTIQTQVDGKFIGYDKGILGMENGLLYFAGRLSSFCLSAQDLKECRPAPRAVDQENGLTVEIDHPFCKHVLEILVLPESRRGTPLAKAIDIFIAEDKPTDEPCSYPPIRKNWVAISNNLGQRKGD